MTSSTTTIGNIDVSVFGERVKTNRHVSDAAKQYEEHARSLSPSKKQQAPGTFSRFGRRPSLLASSYHDKSDLTDPKKSPLRKQIVVVEKQMEDTFDTGRKNDERSRSQSPTKKQTSRNFASFGPKSSLHNTTDNNTGPTSPSSTRSIHTKPLGSSDNITESPDTSKKKTALRANPASLRSSFQTPSQRKLALQLQMLDNSSSHSASSNHSCANSVATQNDDTDEVPMITKGQSWASSYKRPVASSSLKERMQKFENSNATKDKFEDKKTTTLHVGPKRSFAPRAHRATIDASRVSSTNAPKVKDVDSTTAAIIDLPTTTTTIVTTTTTTTKKIRKKKDGTIIVLDVKTDVAQEKAVVADNEAPVTASDGNDIPPTNLGSTPGTAVSLSLKQKSESKPDTTSTGSTMKGESIAAPVLEQAETMKARASPIKKPSFLRRPSTQDSVANVASTCTVDEPSAIQTIFVAKPIENNDEEAESPERRTSITRSPRKPLGLRRRDSVSTTPAVTPEIAPEDSRVESSSKTAKKTFANKFLSQSKMIASNDACKAINGEPIFASPRKFFDSKKKKAALSLPAEASAQSPEKTKPVAEVSDGITNSTRKYISPRKSRTVEKDSNESCSSLHTSDADIKTDKKKNVNHGKLRDASDSAGSLNLDSPPKVDKKKGHSMSKGTDRKCPATVDENSEGFNSMKTYSKFNGDSNTSLNLETDDNKSRMTSPIHATIPESSNSGSLHLDTIPHEKEKELAFKSIEANDSASSLNTSKDSKRKTLKSRSDAKYDVKCEKVSIDFPKKMQIAACQNDSKSIPDRRSVQRLNSALCQRQEKFLQDSRASSENIEPMDTKSAKPPKHYAYEGDDEFWNESPVKKSLESSITYKMGLNDRIGKNQESDGSMLLLDDDFVKKGVNSSLTRSLSVSLHSSCDIERSAAEWIKKKCRKNKRDKKKKTSSSSKKSSNTGTTTGSTNASAHREKKEILVPAVKDLKLHKILGEGSFGQVWLASFGNTDGSDDSIKKKKQKTYALKILSKFNLIQNSEVEALRNEINVLKKVQNQHPCVMNLVAATQDENLIYLMQEFAQGGELFSLLHKHRDTSTGIGGLPEYHACFYAACLADALCFLHTKHLIAFRDLKPENVMLNKYGYPVIIDFGYAKFLDAIDGRTYTLVGTPRYMSPELILSLGYGFGTDNWSLGVLIYELLCGYNAFEGPLLDDDDGLEDTDFFSIVVEDEYLPIPDSKDISEDAKNLVAGLLTKEPADRLGYEDTSAIIDHQWFQSNSIDFYSIRRRKVTAPWIPALSNALDTSHFDDWDHLATNQDTCIIKESYAKLTEREALKFSDFDS